MENEEEDENQNDNHKDQISQTDLTLGAISALETIHKEHLNQEKKEVNSIYSRETFVKNPNKVSFYTGLPSLEVLDLVFDLVCEQMVNNRKSFTKMQEFLICLIKLRMNYLFKDMAFNLNVSVQTVQKSCHDTLQVLFYRLSFLVH